MNKQASPLLDPAPALAPLLSDEVGKAILFSLRDMLHLSVQASPQLTVATELCAAMLANPAFEPSTEKGETRAEATARRACDYAEALMMEYSRRFDGAKGGQP